MGGCINLYLYRSTAPAIGYAGSRPGTCGACEGVRGHSRWNCTSASAMSPGGMGMGFALRLGTLCVVVMVGGQATAATPDLRLVTAAEGQDWKSVAVLIRQGVNVNS